MVLRISWFSESSWFEDFSWFSESSWFEEISWVREIPWVDEISWVGELSWSWEKPWSDVTLWIKIDWFGETSWYEWDPEKDEISPELGELKLNKKLRGERKPSLEPIRTIRDTKRLLSSVLLIRSLIVEKISEFVDP